MSQGKLVFGGGQSSGLEELAGALPPQINCLTDAMGAVRPRPGISAWDLFPATIPHASQVDAIGFFGAYVIYVCADRSIWAIDNAGTVLALSSSFTPTSYLDGGLRPIICPTRNIVVITGGGAPQKWTGTGLSARLGGSPPNMSHIVNFASSLIGCASDPSGILYRSGIGDANFESWATGLDFAEAEDNPDPVIGLYASGGELVAIGTRTVQMFQVPDTFVRSRTMEFGGLSGYGYVPLDEQFMILDTKRRAQLSNGRSFSSTSSPAVAMQLDALTDSSQCWGFGHQFDSYDLGILRWSNYARTLVYDMNLKAWSDWRSYSGGNWVDFKATAYAYRPEDKLRLVGLATGQIAILDPDATTDLGDPIVTEMTTGFQDHGVPEPKHCNRIIFTVRRGPALGPSKFEFSFRDDLGAFCAPFTYDLDDDDADPIIVEDSLDVYVTRQWRVRCTNARLSLAGANETFTLART